MAKTIMVVDDEKRLVSLVESYLTREGYRVVTAHNGKDALTAARREKPDLIVLDVMMPEMDGYEFMRKHRADNNTPIILLTARVDDEEKVIGLEVGADDYMTKPFRPRELVARVRAVLRRQEMGRLARTHDPERGGYRFDGWLLERRGRRLLDPNATSVALSKGEYALLLAFLEAPQRPLSREYLLQATRVHEDIFDRSIDVQVLRLRRKLEVDPSAPRVIRTERGVGYVFALPVEPF